MQETFEDFRKRQENAQDKRRQMYSIHQRLLDSLKAVAHREDYIIGDTIRSRSATEPGSGWSQAEKRLKQRKFHPWKDYDRIAGCQTEWKGFRPTCCNGAAVAVPIGCNHRLCPLCNAHRAEHYRSRVKGLFAQPRKPATEDAEAEERNWQLLTLTVPNIHKLSRVAIMVLRQRLKRFLKAHAALIQGGVYSIEITFNRTERTWHPHIHALVDIAGPAGKLDYADFMERKWRLEFAWFVLTQGKRERRWKDADFEEWVAPLDPRRQGLPLTPMRVKQFAGGRFGERRSVDIRPVSSDKKAAYEVMKYMTKVAFFVDDPAALAEFLTAVKGVRAIQTFGSCYGFKLDDAPVESSLKCDCGKNEFDTANSFILGLGMVSLSPEGRWTVRDDAPVHGRLARCRGGTTGGRPTC